jgi:N-terminal domain of toast_rack, DUF2154
MFISLRRLLAAVAVPALLLLTGCDFEDVKTGPPRNESLSVDLGRADHANIELDFGAGQLNLKGGGDNLISGNFEYNADALKPMVQTSRNGSHAVVTIKQTGHTNMHGNMKSQWNLQLNNKTLLDLALNCGAGQADLDLRDVAIRSLRVQMGAGQVNLDLRGHPTRDYEVEISGGVGQATVHLPEGIGIRAEAHGGLGSINVNGLEKVGDHYENSLYDKAKVNLRLKVQGGIGEINLLSS